MQAITLLLDGLEQKTFVVEPNTTIKFIVENDIPVVKFFVFDTLEFITRNTSELLDICEVVRIENTFISSRRFNTTYVSWKLGKTVSKNGIRFDTTTFRDINDTSVTVARMYNTVMDDVELYLIKD